MKEKFSSPHNPSEAFTNDSYDYNASQHKTFDERMSERQSAENILDSEAAAYAAKPWMDVAVELHDAKNAAARGDLDKGETAYDINVQGSLEYLTTYAERRAHQAAEGTHNELVTDDEVAMLDAFKAEAEMNRAEAGVAIDDLTAEHVDRAYELARNREKAALAKGERAEARKWGDLKKRADEYNELVFGELDFNDQEEANRSLRPDAKNAGYLLSMSKDGVVEASAGISRASVAVDAANMRKTAKLYELLAEVQSAQPEASTGIPASAAQEMLKKQYEMVARQESQYTEAIDPEELEDATFTAAQREIWNQQKNADNQEQLAKWNALNKSLGLYKNAVLNGLENELPEDISELMRRRDLKEFLAAMYPKPTAEAEHTTASEKNETAEAQTEYDPDDTILPTSEKGRSMMRLNFANEYFSEQSHQQFTPDNIKLLKDYMVHEMRGEINYAQRQSARVKGNQASVFRSVFTLKDLERNDRAVNKFAYELAKHNTNRPDLMFAQFEQMSTKDIAQIVGFDITEYVEEYDKYVTPNIAKEVSEEKPYEAPPMR